jgi:hypothetical protein
MMRPPVQRAVVFAVLVFTACSLFAAQAPPESVPVFCDRVLSVLMSVNLRHTGSGLKVVVLAMPAQLAEADRIASKLTSESRRRGLRFNAIAWDLSKDVPMPPDTVAAILLDMPPLVRGRVMMVARGRNLLTIGRRPDDVDHVGVVLLSDGNSCRNDAELGRQKLPIEAPEMLGVLEPVSVYKARMKALAEAADTKRRKERAEAEKATKATLAEAHSAYRSGRSRQLRGVGQWPEVVKELRSAIALHPIETVSTVSLGSSTMNEPYLPHFYLGEALAQIGDCKGAVRELGQSAAATRRALNAQIAARVITTVEKCGKPQPPATPRGRR